MPCQFIDQLAATHFPNLNITVSACCHSQSIVLSQHYRRNKTSVVELPDFLNLPLPWIKTSIVFSLTTYLPKNCLAAHTASDYLLSICIYWCQTFILTKHVHAQTSHIPDTRYTIYTCCDTLLTVCRDWYRWDGFLVLHSLCFLSLKHLVHKP